MDDTRYDGEDARWVSYAELAKARRISKESAIRLARRERWRKMPGNEVDGTVRVLAPEAWLKPVAREDVRPGRAADPGADTPADLSRMAAGWEQAIVLSRLRAEVAEARADRAEDRADKADQRAGRAEERADRAEIQASALREQLEASRQEIQGVTQLADTRVSELRGQLEAAGRKAEEAAQGTEVLRRAEADRKGRGRLARLRAAWRGE